MKIVNLTKNTVLADKAVLASSALNRLKGLLLHSRLAEGEGLIIRPCNSIHTFFMRFKIDVLFVDSKNRVVRVYKEMPPFRLSRVYFQAACAVELPAGTAAATNTEQSDTLSIL